MRPIRMLGAILLLALSIAAPIHANTTYFDFGGLLMPGLWLNAGIMVRI